MIKKLLTVIVAIGGFIYFIKKSKHSSTKQRLLAIDQPFAEQEGAYVKLKNDV